MRYCSLGLAGKHGGHRGCVGSVLPQSVGRAFARLAERERQPAVQAEGTSQRTGSQLRLSDDRVKYPLSFGRKSCSYGGSSNYGGALRIHGCCCCCCQTSFSGFGATHMFLSTPAARLP